MSFKKIFTLVIACCIAGNGLAIDTTPFYRTTLFQGETKQSSADWVTYINAQYTEVTTRQSWNTQEVETELFDAYGHSDMGILAKNLENLASYPLTQAYANGTNPAGNIGALTDSNVKFKGRFHMSELDLTLQQNLFWGFFAQAYFPIRDLHINEIDVVQVVESDADHATLVDFIDNDLDPILEEHGIKPIKTNFKKHALADPMLSVGWHGRCCFNEGLVTGLRGFVQAGVLIPSGSRKPIDQIFALPLGNNKHWGFSGRANAHATLWKKFVLGANGGVTVFMDQTYEQRLATAAKENQNPAIQDGDPLTQNGYVLLGRAKATTDPGTQWDVTVYGKAERIFGGLSAMIGYSYTQREADTLTLKDNDFLQTALLAGDIKKKNEIVNADKQLSEWYQHVLHAYVEYDLGAHLNSIPELKLQVAYHHPLIAKHSWAKELWSGEIGLGVDWRF